MSGREAASRVAARFESRFLRHYTRSKLRNDPVYDAVLARLNDGPLFDLGCGVGILELYLRENGFSQPIVGVDHDAAKIAVANRLAASYGDLQFVVGDARQPIPHGSSVTALDVLHYFGDDEQTAILESIAAAIPPGGVAIIRDCLRDDSLRFGVTRLQEQFSRAIRWLKAERLHFPTMNQIATPFRRRGFAEDIAPLWGSTPFNNYLFVFTRSAPGTTNR